MKVLIIGAGVIGTVYGAHLGAAGHTVHVRRHPPRTDDVAVSGLAAHEVLNDDWAASTASVVTDIGADRYDLVLVAVRSDQLAQASGQLATLGGSPAVLFFGNNPGGRSALPAQIPGEVRLGFPGVGGVIRDGVADYVRIRQQPTALEAASDPRLAELERTLRRRGFAVQRVADMEGWLAYHAAFVACVAAALYRCATDAARLAADREVLKLMCAAVTEAFAALRRAGVRGLPRNLAVLHSPPLRPVAVRYWARTMRSPAGELCFAAHARHARPEMQILGDQVTARLADSPGTSHLRQLLQPSPHDLAPRQSSLQNSGGCGAGIQTPLLATSIAKEQVSGEAGEAQFS
jgi:2-dehydropantoate 2-reductase